MYICITINNTNRCHRKCIAQREYQMFSSSHTIYSKEDSDVMELDMYSNVPIYQQIRDQIVFLAAKGELVPGEKLPTVRQLAADIGINPMTVNKAYGLLKDEGVIVIDRRKGAKIAEDLLEKVKGRHVFDRDFDDRMRLLVSEAITRGATEKELRTHIEDILAAAFGKE